MAVYEKIKSLICTPTDKFCEILCSSCKKRPKTSPKQARNDDDNDDDEDGHQSKMKTLLNKVQEAKPHFTREGSKRRPTGWDPKAPLPVDDEDEDDDDDDDYEPIPKQWKSKKSIMTYPLTITSTGTSIEQTDHSDPVKSKWTNKDVDIYSSITQQRAVPSRYWVRSNLQYVILLSTDRRRQKSSPRISLPPSQPQIAPSTYLPNPLSQPPQANSPSTLLDSPPQNSTPYPPSTPQQISPSPSQDSAHPSPKRLSFSPIAASEPSTPRESTPSLTPTLQQISPSLPHDSVSPSPKRISFSPMVTSEPTPRKSYVSSPPTPKQISPSHSNDSQTPATAPSTPPTPPASPVVPVTTAADEKPAANKSLGNSDSIDTDKLFSKREGVGTIKKKTPKKSDSDSDSESDSNSEDSWF